jgi:hypothetical protein
LLENSVLSVIATILFVIFVDNILLSGALAGCEAVPRTLVQPFGL